MHRIDLRFIALAAIVSSLSSLSARAQFTTPTKEELSMTSQPEVPGAAAVYLFREEDTEDKYHTWSKYARIKVLTEKGKDYANVELRQFQGANESGYTIGDIEGRTIHSDGTIIPFTGKPFDKLIQQGSGYKTSAKVFTLPDVEIGSIIEYRYKLEYYDHRVFAPSWFVQSELFTRKAHYLWRPTRTAVITSDEKGAQVANNIAWTPILPKDASFTHVQTSGTGHDAGEVGQTIMELKIQNVPPAPEEEYMPPIGSLTYRVLFYYTPYLSNEDFWKGEGKRWSKLREEFIGSGPKVAAAVQDILSSAGSDTQDQKLRKLYAAVMQLDNTSFTRSRSAAEEKSQGLGEAKTTDDIWERKRGTDNQLTQLFVAMARAAGMKAYLMTITDRSRTLFVPSYLSLSQFHDDIAIVAVDGKEQFFDPGQRDCPYGQLAWKHSITSGLRQVDGGGAKLAGTPPPSYKDARTQRVANLTLDSRGTVSGTVKMTWSGAPALEWRQIALRGDVTSLQRELRVSMERMLPAGMQAEIAGIQNLDEYENPLIVTFDVKGVPGSATGKRLLLPGDLFESRTRPIFPHEKREVSVYFHYPYQIQDAVRIAFPASFSVESLPASQKLPLQQSGTYALTTEATPTSITVRRDLVVGNVAYQLADYPELRNFFTKLETKDQEPTVLKVASSGPSGN